MFWLLLRAIQRVLYMINNAALLQAFWGYVHDSIHSDSLHRFADTQAEFTAVSISHSA